MPSRAGPSPSGYTCAPASTPNPRDGMVNVVDVVCVDGGPVGVDGGGVVVIGYNAPTVGTPVVNPRTSMTNGPGGPGLSDCAAALDAMSTAHTKTARRIQ